GQAVAGRVAVFNALPAGWSEDFLGSATLASMHLSAPPPVACAMPMTSFAADADADAGMLFELRDSSSVPPAAGLASAFGSLFHPRSRASKSGRGAPDAKVIFSGTPILAGGEAVLFDSTKARKRGGLPEEATLGRLEIRFLDGMPDPHAVDPGLELL